LRFWLSEQSQLVKKCLFMNVEKKIIDLEFNLLNILTFYF